MFSAGFFVFYTLAVRLGFFIKKVIYPQEAVLCDILFARFQFQHPYSAGWWLMRHGPKALELSAGQCLRPVNVWQRNASEHGVSNYPANRDKLLSFAFGAV